MLTAQNSRLGWWLSTIFANYAIPDLRGLKAMEIYEELKFRLIETNFTSVSAPRKIKHGHADRTELKPMGMAIDHLLARSLRQSNRKLRTISRGP